MVEFKRNIAFEASKLPDDVLDPTQSVLNRADALKNKPKVVKKRRIPWFLIMWIVSGVMFYSMGGMDIMKSVVAQSPGMQQAAMITEAAQKASEVDPNGEKAQVSIQMNGQTYTQEVSIPQMEALQKLQQSGAF